ncbi:MAG: helix-turn-helix domain-containing protein [Pseudonocardiaceae bacterium]
MDDDEDVRAIGWALWQARDDRGKSLRVVAELAGMSKDTLNRIERGLLSPTLDQVYALAQVLQVSVSDLTRLPFPAPANGHTDSSVEAIGLALDAIEIGEPAGMILPVAELQDQVRHLHRQRRACRFVEVATELPTLIRNLHTSLNTGTDHGELLDLAVYLHVHVTRIWLGTAAAPAHLLRRVVFLAKRLAEEREEVTTLAMAGYGVASVLLTRGAFEPGRVVLGSLTLPPTTAGTAGLVCALTTLQALAAVRQERPDEAVPALDTAAELAQRFGAAATDPLGFILAPTDVGIERMWLALEAGEPDRAVSIAPTVHPERHPFKGGQAQYWLQYGCALAQIGDHHEDAVRALRTAERIYPTRMLRNQFVRDTLAVLLRHSRRGSTTDQELRGMARRARLIV